MEDGKGANISPASGAAQGTLVAEIDYLGLRLADPCVCIVSRCFFFGLGVEEVGSKKGRTGKEKEVKEEGLEESFEGGGIP